MIENTPSAELWIAIQKDIYSVAGQHQLPNMAPPSKLEKKIQKWLEGGGQ